MSDYIFQVLCDMPTLDINISLNGQLLQNSDAVQQVEVPMSKENWIVLHQNEVNK